ncbi:glycosyltransferase family 1 protein [Granulicella sp. S190]|uniref:glycosyltransferase family 4 protein n=1 Tax=Granulicella sp. S190 TaxID=1747226 RepID=UPI00210F53CD|nr:glycosyltransferase family 1 protein [Granulicella sp. S190]
MNLLITAVSSSRGPSGICRHAYSLVCCAIARPEISRITLVIGEWQESYFRHSFRLESEKLDFVIINISNDAAARNLWYLRDLPKLARYLCSDLIHLSFPVPIRKNKFNCPVVVSLHDLYPYDEPDNFGYPKVFLNRIILKKCLEEVDLVACVSQTTLQRLKVRFPKAANKKGIVVHNCVNISAQDLRSSIVADVPFFLIVAQHRANKNIPMALRAFGKLLRTGKIDKRTLLLLLGNHGPETAMIRAVIHQEGLEASVNLIDGVSDEELRWLYKNCQVLLAPSFMEGFGLPVVEGLLCGSRVVCSDIPSFREIGGESCHYFDVLSAKGISVLAEAICDALASPFKPVEDLDRFSLMAISESLMAVYNTLHEREGRAQKTRKEAAVHCSKAGSGLYASTRAIDIQSSSPLDP